MRGIAGDFTTRGTRDQLEDFDQWLGRQDFRHKVVVPGNHDNAMDPFVRSINIRHDTNILIDNVVEEKEKNWTGDNADAKGSLKNATVLLDDTVEIPHLWQPTHLH
jgi:hypothetical protein